MAGFKCVTQKKCPPGMKSGITPSVPSSSTVFAGSVLRRKITTPPVSNIIQLTNNDANRKGVFIWSNVVNITTAMYFTDFGTTLEYLIPFTLVIPGTTAQALSLTSVLHHALPQLGISMSSGAAGFSIWVIETF
jgi:hypothetical protein